MERIARFAVSHFHRRVMIAFKVPHTSLKLEEAKCPRFAKRCHFVLDGDFKLPHGCFLHFLNSNVRSSSIAHPVEEGRKKRPATVWKSLFGGSGFYLFVNHNNDTFIMCNHPQ